MVDGQGAHFAEEVPVQPCPVRELSVDAGAGESPRLGDSATDHERKWTVVASRQ
jgi:hypothetical protein